MKNTGQANRICHDTGERTEGSECFLCGYQQSCNRYSRPYTENKRDHTGAYVDVEPVCESCKINL